MHYVMLAFSSYKTHHEIVLRKGRHKSSFFIFGYGLNPMEILIVIAVATLSLLVEQMYLAFDNCFAL
jgi:hypothetical protein